MNVNNTKLLKEISLGRKEIKTDSFSMSIGELINLYRDGDLELTPAYQRLFRWEDEQKSKFIESILLGIPLPPIFVAQKENGKWSVVDGLQRLSTILQLTGELKDKDPLVLTTTKKLPSLEDHTWLSLSEDIQRTLKRSKFSINVILTENSIQAQYELFQRLNTGGLHLEPQEIRNCLIIMLDNDFFKSLEEVKTFVPFINSLDIQEGKLNIEYHMELILRYFIMKHNTVDYSHYKISSTLLSDFIDEETINLIEDKNFDLKKEIDVFKRTFTYLNKNLGKNTFKKFNLEKGKFEGAFSNSSFEAIVSGVSLNIDSVEKLSKSVFVDKVKSLYSESNFLLHSKRGTKALARIKGLSDFSKEFFK